MSSATIGLMSSASLLDSYKRQMEHNKISVVDSWFPLFEYMSFHIKVFGIIYYFSTGIFYIHSFLFSLWPCRDIWKTFPRFSNFFQCFMFFRPNMDFDSIKTFGILAFLVCLILWSFILSVNRYYKKNQQFIGWAVHIVRFIVEILPLLTIHPSAFLLGKSIYSLMETYNRNNLIPFFGVLIYYLSCLILVYVSSSLFSRVLNIKVTPLSCFEAKSLMKFIITSSSSLIMDNLLYNFPKWAGIFLQFSYIVLFALCFHSFLGFPFFQYNHSVIALSITLLCIQSSLFAVLLSIFPNSYILLSILCGFLCFFLELGLVLTLKWRWNKIVDQLNITKVQYVDKIDKIYIQYGLDQSMEKALMYVRVGFIEHCPLFMDWSLIKFVSSHFSNTNINCFCIQLLSFFPSEIRLLNYFYSMAILHTDFEFKDRFVIYQVNKIKTQRQTISTNEAIESLTQLKASSFQCEVYMKSFWSQKAFNLDNIIGIHSNVIRIRSQWEEAIREYPNNYRFYDDFCWFLVEVQCDFLKAVYQKHTKETLENNKERVLDQSFKNFVIAYPKYIKNNIVDTRGNIVGIESTQHFTGELVTTSSSSSEETFLEADMEECIGKSLFSEPRVRIAIDKSLKGQKLFSSMLIRITSILSIVLFSIFILYIYWNHHDEIEMVSKSLNQVNFLMKSRYFSSMAAYYIVLEYANQTNRLHILDNCSLFKTTFKQLSSNSITHANQQFSLLLNDFALRSKNVLFKNQRASILFFENRNNVSFCIKGVPVWQESFDMSTLFSFSSFLEGYIISTLNNNDIFKDDFFCELYSSLSTFQQLSHSLAEIFTQYSEDNYYSMRLTLKNLNIIVAVIAFSVNIIPIVFSILIFIKEIKRLGIILINLSPDQKVECQQSIFKGNHDSSLITHVNPSRPFKALLRVFGLTIMLIFIDLLFFVMIGCFKTINLNMFKLIKWNYHSSCRLPCVIESVLFSDLAFLIHQSNITSYLNSTFLIKNAINQLADLDFHNRQIIYGNSSIDPINGYDSFLDIYNTISNCSTIISDNYQDIYKCGSLNQVLGIFRVNLLEILQIPETQNGRLDSTELLHIRIMMHDYILAKLENTLDRMMNISSNLYSVMNSNFVFIDFCLILLSGTFSYFLLRLSSYLDSIFCTLLSLVKRIPPLNILNNPDLLQTLLNISSSQGVFDSSLSGKLIHASKTAVLITTQLGIIELINPSFTRIFGYSHEQIIGQNISLLLSHEENPNLSSQMKRSLENQEHNGTEICCQCISDNSQNIPCRIVLHPIYDDDFRFHSFAFIFYDNSSTFQKEKQLTDLKKRSEILLLSIYPKDLFGKIENINKSISYSVLSGSIMFANIHKFHELSIMLTHVEVFDLLSQILSIFDKQLKKYKYLTKIKTISDTYIVGAGLFGQNHLKEATDELIQFSFEILREIDEMNIRFNTDYGIKIGIHTGGPLIVALFQREKPSFEIIGNTVGVSLLIKNSSIPGKIHISRDTYKLVMDSAYIVESTGVVTTKDNQKIETYILGSAH